MRTFAAATMLCLTNLIAGQAASQTVDEQVEVKPRVYALLAAIGDQFSVIAEVVRTGSHLSPYERRTNQLPDDILNRLALHALDQAIAKIDPASTRVYMALPAMQLDSVAPSERGSVAISRITHALAAMPQRREWDRIVIVTPGYRALELKGLAPRLQGFGLFAETACQAACGGPRPEDEARASMQEPPDGVDAITSEDKPIKARTFVAPFSYIEVWVLDPKTLAVLDRQQALDRQKLAEPVYRPLDLSDDAGQRYIAMRIANLIDLSVAQAVQHSEINARHGIVEFGRVKEASPDAGPQ